MVSSVAKKEVLMETNGHTSAEKFVPRLVFWETTKGCNLRCIHCRATATELSSPTDLSTVAVIGRHRSDCWDG
jgi:MoaA/NifB/PqqE/SkfB family radical SAM enzyme